MQRSFSKIVVILFVILLITPANYPESADNSPEYDEVARILGGIANADSGLPGSITQSNEYRAYKKRTDLTWKKFQESLLTSASKWQKENLANIKTETLFYPFSGPDAVNAFTFFPDAKEYVMLGLEKPGEIPDFKHKSVKEISTGLNKLEMSLNTLIGVNYFFTNNMAEEIGSHSFNGVIGVVMHFLVRTGNEIIRADYISLDSSGNEIVLDSHGKPVLADENGKAAGIIPNKFFRAAKIVFKKRGGSSGAEKTLYYFQLDASDAKLALVPEFTTFVLKKKELTTMLKASSYLLFSRYFDDMRSIILTRSRYVFQGASGIPYHHFKADPEWELKLYGRYTKPTPLFLRRCQPDLVKDSKELPAGELNFNYDYFYRGEKSFILVARRKDSWKPTNPEFDKSNDKGKETFCQQDSRKVVNNLEYASPAKK